MTNQSVGQKSTKEDSKTSSADGTAEKPIAEIGVERRVVALEVRAGVVGPRVAAGVADGSGEQQEQHGCKTSC